MGLLLVLGVRPRAAVVPPLPGGLGVCAEGFRLRLPGVIRVLRGSARTSAGARTGVKTCLETE